MKSYYFERVVERRAADTVSGVRSEITKGFYFPTKNVAFGREMPDGEVVLLSPKVVNELREYIPRRDSTTLRGVTYRTITEAVVECETYSELFRDLEKRDILNRRMLERLTESIDAIVNA